MQKEWRDDADCKGIQWPLHYRVAGVWALGGIQQSKRPQNPCHECLCDSRIFHGSPDFVLRPELVCKINFVDKLIGFWNRKGNVISNNPFPPQTPRSSLARWFGLIERCPRFLSLGWDRLSARQRFQSTNVRACAHQVFPKKAFLPDPGAHIRRSASSEKACVFVRPFCS